MSESTQNGATNTAQASTPEERVTQVNLEELGKFLNKRASASTQSKWITLEDNETVFMEFDPGRIEIVTRDNKFKPGTQTTRIRFTVHDGNGDERFFETSATTADMLNTYLGNGYRRLKVQRKGTDKETRYFAFPAEQPQQQGSRVG